MAAMVTTGNGSCHLVPIIFFWHFCGDARSWEFKLKFFNAKTVCAWFLNMCTIPLPSLAWSDCWSNFWIASAALGLVNSNPEWLSGSWRWCCNLSRLTKAKSSTGMQTGLYPTASKAWRNKIKKKKKVRNSCRRKKFSPLRVTSWNYWYRHFDYSKWSSSLCGRPWHPHSENHLEWLKHL